MRNKTKQKNIRKSVYFQISFHFIVTHDMAAEYYTLKTIIKNIISWTTRERNLTFSIIMKTVTSNVFHYNSSDFKGVPLA